jgi:hypothetical protein
VTHLRAFGTRQCKQRTPYIDWHRAYSTTSLLAAAHHYIDEEANDPRPSSIGTAKRLWHSQA